MWGLNCWFLCCKMNKSAFNSRFLLIFSTVFRIFWKSNKTKLAASRQNLHFNLFISLFWQLGESETDVWTEFKCDAGCKLCKCACWSSVVSFFLMSPLLYKDIHLYFTVLYFFWLWEQILFFCDSFRVCWTFFDVTEPFCNSLWNLLCNFVVQQLKSYVHEASL